MNLSVLTAFFDAIWGVIKTFYNLGGYFKDGITFEAIALLLFFVIFHVALIFIIIMWIRKKVFYKEASSDTDALIKDVQRLSAPGGSNGGYSGLAYPQGVGGTGSSDDDEDEDGALKEGESRFYKLTQVDLEYADYVAPEYDNNITLPEICEMFRNFACSRMKLYYDIKIIRLFLASFASTRLIILQGISGTGKTSLPYAFGKFLQNDAIIASVQPSWRDRAELFGYFNEFTKRFNETEVLKKMYEATYNENIYLTILDEMNIARVEYYFAEMLSILEMPSRDEWVIDLVPSVWESDPKHLTEGKLKLPDNMWYIGTCNNDDSTFAVTDKVYDRAMSIDINEKGKPFEAPYTENLNLSYKHLESMFRTAFEENKVSEENLKKIADLDDYVIEHFRLAFGNRIVKQLKEYVPAYVACGGTELDGLDYVLCHKILRKFHSLNMSFVRDEIPGLITYLDKLFGKNNMNECKDYLRRLQKLI